MEDASFAPPIPGVDSTEPPAEDEEEDDDDTGGGGVGKNILPVWGNQKTMNMNTLIVENIVMSHYFKIKLKDLKTYHEVLDEAFYHVTHLEPWEKGSRKTSGQTGMCGGVRGVAAGGIVSSCFSLLYKFFTIKLTRKQVRAMITSQDSPYIRAMGFMYIRFCQPPVTLWEWYEEFLDDDEEVDVRAGGGLSMSIGDMLRHFLTKLDWHSTLFPRIPVPVQKQIEEKLRQRSLDKYGDTRFDHQTKTAPPATSAVTSRGASGGNNRERNVAPPAAIAKEKEPEWGTSARKRDSRDRERERDWDRSRERDRDRDKKDRDRDRRSDVDRYRGDRSDRDASRSSRDYKDRYGSRGGHDRDRRRSRSREKERSYGNSSYSSRKR